VSSEDDLIQQIREERTVDQIHRKYTEPNYIGPYPKQHAHLAPLLFAIVTLTFIGTGWAYYNTDILLEVEKIIIAAQIISLTYVTGFLGVWWIEREKEALE